MSSALGGGALINYTDASINYYAPNQQLNTVHINHLIFSDCFRADISCSKLPLRWLDIRAKCDGVGGLEISTQAFLEDDLSSIKHLRIQLLCKEGGGGKDRERSVQRGH